MSPNKSRTVLSYSARLRRVITRNGNGLGVAQLFEAVVPPLPGTLLPPLAVLDEPALGLVAPPFVTGLPLPPPALGLPLPPCEAEFVEPLPALFDGLPRVESSTISELQAAAIPAKTRANLVCWIIDARAGYSMCVLSTCISTVWLEAELI